MTIISLSIRALGHDTVAHFRFSPACSLAAKCDGCGSRSRATLAPVILRDDREPAMDGKPLCKVCSTVADHRWNAAWPTLTSGGARSAWALVSTEKDREALEQSAREQSVATTLDDLQRAAAAIQQARSHQGVNSFGKVA